MCRCSQRFGQSICSHLRASQVLEIDLPSLNGFNYPLEANVNMPSTRPPAWVEHQCLGIEAGTNDRIGRLLVYAAG